jgi:hypothetical protein
MASAKIHVGVGGWDHDPWRGTFYPPGLAKTKQLEFASRRLTATGTSSSISTAKGSRIRTCTGL